MFCGNAAFRQSDCAMNNLTGDSLFTIFWLTNLYACAVVAAVRSFHGHLSREGFYPDAISVDDAPDEAFATAPTRQTVREEKSASIAIKTHHACIGYNTALYNPCSALTCKVTTLGVGQNDGCGTMIIRDGWMMRHRRGASSASLPPHTA